jgi:hypothetical protein
MRLVVYALASILALAGPALAADPMPRVVTIWGSGEVQATPDMATVSAGVITNADTAKAALAANSPAMEKVLKVARDAGIEPRDVQTRGVRIAPIFSRQTQPDDPPRISGYSASNTVTVRLRDLSKLGALLDGLVTAGANQMSGPRFSMAEPDRLLDQARREAIADAKRKAELYTQTAGVKLGGVVAIEETGPVGRPAAFANEGLMARAASVPVEVGELSISTSVRVVFALE